MQRSTKIIKLVSKFLKYFLQIGLISFSCFGLSADELNLTAFPLFVSSSIESNVYFILDDSASMDWGLMIGSDIVDDGVANIDGVMLAAGNYGANNGLAIIDDDIRLYMHPNFVGKANWVVVPTVETNPEAWLLRNSIANPLYYNPETNYVPWPGTDSNGNNLYSNAIPTAARNFPYRNAGEVADLTQDVGYTKWWWDGGWQSSEHDIYFAVYYKWVDDGDGIVEQSDSYIEVEIKQTNAALFETVNVTESDGSVSIRKRTYTEEMQNYANWFQYYRKREFLAKVAIGHVVSGTDSVRMGLSSINGGHIFDAKSMSDPENRAELLAVVYDINSNGGTPLRGALREVGEMFRGATGDPSPILSDAEGGSCQQNFQILMTDGFWNGAAPTGIDNDDGDSNSSFDGGFYADTFDDTLADVAMFYYENDLAPSLANDVPTIDNVDEANHQHLVTYTVAFGLKGELDNEALNPDAGEVVWPDPEVSDRNKIDDLWHAAYNGRGEYLNVAFPDELSAALDEIIDDIAERSATASAVAVNSAKLTTDTMIYLAEFNTFRWQGEIYAYKIIDIETGELKATPEWEAADVLNARNLVSEPRAIITYNGLTGTAFQWSDITKDQKADLYVNSVGGNDTAIEAEARLNFIRGDRTNEGAGFFFRERSAILGDVVNSGPVYVAEPDLTWPDTAPFPTSNIYSQFQYDEAQRDGVIYVAANDGMLHAFAEGDGSELFAYLPNMLFSTETTAGMHYLTSTNYVHSFYNDLTPTISDVYINPVEGAGGSDTWNTILIGGLRGGGRGLYALNITDPGSFSEANAADMVMWEFTNADDNDLGFTYSRPQVALANNGKWVAIFGNGYNGEGSGESALFIVDIEAGIDGWDSGDYIKINTGSGSSNDVNGLSTPVLADIDGDGDVDRVYAGDLEGQLWVFDLSSNNPSSWALADSEPLFTTIDNRPITAKPALSLHPTVDSLSTNAPNILVFFGSGQYLVKRDITDNNQNHFYGVWDSGTYNLTSTSLTQQFVDASFTNDRVMTNNAVDYATKKGWYMALEISGERSVTKAVVRFGVVFFNTFIPSDNGCTSGGYGFKMAVDAATGGALDDAAFDSNGDGLVDENDTTSGSNRRSIVNGIEQDGYLPEPVFIENLSYTAETPIKVQDEPNINSGRLSWQELLQ